MRRHKGYLSDPIFWFRHSGLLKHWRWIYRFCLYPDTEFSQCVPAKWPIIWFLGPTKPPQLLMRISEYSRVWTWCLDNFCLRSPDTCSKIKLERLISLIFGCWDYLLTGQFITHLGRVTNGELLIVSSAVSLEFAFPFTALP